MLPFLYFTVQKLSSASHDDRHPAGSGIELRELQVFLTLGEELHFGRTAERLQLTASRVSQTISTLETRVGGRLFNRTSRRVELTPLGEQLLANVTPAYDQLQHVLLAARESARGVTGPLRIGIYSPGTVGTHMVEIVREFTDRHPAATAMFVTLGVERNYLDALRRGEVEMVVARLPLTEPDVSVGPVLSHEDRILLVASGDPLAERESISWEDVADHTVSDMETFPREMLDAFIPPSTPSGKRLRRAINRTIEEAMMRVALGQQVHPSVTSFPNYLNHPGVVAVPISDLPPSETALAWRTDDRSAKTRAFAEAAADVLAGTELAPHQPARRAAERPPR